MLGRQCTFIPPNHNVHMTGWYSHMAFPGDSTINHAALTSSIMMDIYLLHVSVHSGDSSMHGCYFVDVVTVECLMSS